MEEIALNRNKYIYLPKYNQLINREIKDLFLKNSKKLKVEDISINEKVIKSRINKNLNQLIFEITQNCNLRCRYCVYSGVYLYKRNRSQKSLNFETSRKSLNYVYNLIKDRKEKNFVIGFYGGEPLLRFNTIKRITRYSRRLFDGWNLTFSLTTNGTLLSREMINFFINNKFLIDISLDGPSINHDAKRIFRDGKGTFNCIISNLVAIKNMDESYYYKNVQFQAVHSWDLSLKKLFDFFVNNELVKRNNVLLTNVDLQNSDYYKRFPYDRKCLLEEFEIINTIIKKKFINKEKLFPIELEFLAPYRVLFTDLNTRRFSIIFGACLFDSRLFLDSDGNYHICEKINHKFPIGNVDNGLNYKKMVKMAKEFINIFNTRCKNCDVKYLCRRCYAMFGKDGKFEIDDDYCRFSRNSIIKGLEDLIKNKEAGMNTY